MFKLNEIIHILIAVILFAFVINFLKDFNSFLTALLVAFIIIFVSILAKKLMAYFLESEIEQKILHWQRWGWYQRSYFKKPLPIGVILPFVMVWLSYPAGFFKMLTFLQFDVKPTSGRAAKKHGLYRFTEMTEWHIAAIAGFGIFSCLVLAVISYFLGGYAGWIPVLGKFSIYYAVWNLIPFGQLDGCKLFFGSRRLWFLLAVLSIIGLGYALFII